MQRFGFRHSIGLPVAWLGLTMTGILWFGVWYQINSEFDAARRHTDQELKNFSRVFEEHIVRTVRELDKTLLIARKRYLKTRETKPYSEAIGQPLPDPALLSDLSFQMAAIDRDGILRATTMGKHPPHPINLQDRAYFKLQKSRRSDTPHISKPVLGRKSGRWSVQLTRRIEGPEGLFDGLLVASMDPGLFGRFYGSINFGHEKTVLLAGSDGHIRVSSGSAFIKLGDNIAGTDLMQNARKGEGIYTGDTDGSGVERIYALRKVPEQPLFVVVGVSYDEAFAAANSNRARYLTVAAIVSCLIILAVVASINHQMTIANMARYDDLTGLANRAFFRETIEAALSNFSRRRSFTVFLIDVDKFKFANDAFGHNFGDKLLREVAKRLQRSTRKSDLIARLGGDEFAVILKDVKDPGETAARAGHILKTMREPLIIDGQQIMMTASIGSETVTDQNITPERLLRNADLALYEAKSGGRNCYKRFVPAIAERFTEKRKLEADLRDALQRNQLQLHYQVIQSLQDDRVAGFEALVRWNHHEKGLISPTEFVPIAEETGLIIPIGEWVLREACIEAMTMAPDKRIAVNLSAVQFRDPKLVEKIASALETSGLPPERLELEITESLMMQESASVIDTIRQIRGLGIKIAMDDFGTGYSSLSYLCSFEFDKIKIDRSFVKGLSRHSNYAAIVRTIVNLARSLNVRTTAEGIETVKELELIKAMGCTEGQGFLFSAPMPIEKLRAFVDFNPVSEMQTTPCAARPNEASAETGTALDTVAHKQENPNIARLKRALGDTG